MELIHEHYGNLKCIAGSEVTKTTLKYSTAALIWIQVNTFHNMLYTQLFQWGRFVLFKFSSLGDSKIIQYGLHAAIKGKRRHTLTVDQHTCRSTHVCHNNLGLRSYWQCLCQMNPFTERTTHSARDFKQSNTLKLSFFSDYASASC